MSATEYVRKDHLIEWFKARDKDLFSVKTICEVIDALPETIGFVEPFTDIFKEEKEFTEITDRIQKEDNLNKVFFLDEKGPGGGYHKYLVLNGRTGTVLADLTFQNGPRLAYDSVQGILDNDLLEIVRHRLAAFCEGDMKDENTYKAMLCVEGALGFLARRTEERKKRGVLGTMER